MADQKDDRISHFIDSKGIQDDKDEIIKALEAVKEKIKEVDKIKMSLFGKTTISNAIKDIKDLNTAQQQLNKTMEQSAKIREANSRADTAELNRRIKELDLLKKERAAQTAAAGGGSNAPKQPKQPKTPLSPFEQLKADAKVAKLAYQDLITQQQKYGNISNSQLDAALQNWKELEQQIKLTGSVVKTTFNDDQNFNKQISDAKKLNNAWEALRLTILQLQQEGQQLAAKGILGSPLSDAEKQRLKEIEIEVQRLTAALAKADNQLGKSAKSQYAYSAQLFSLQQILRETPNIAFGWNIFLASLSNNIPILTDDLQRLIKRNKELNEAGQKTVPVWRQVLKSLGSWSTVIAFAVAAITILGKDIEKLFNKLVLSRAEYRKQWLASKEFAEIQKRLADAVKELTAAFDKLNDVREKSRNYGTTALKSELAAMEALGVAASKLWVLKKQIADLEAENVAGDISSRSEGLAQSVLAQDKIDIALISEQLDILKLEREKMAKDFAKTPDIYKFDPTLKQFRYVPKTQKDRGEEAAILAKKDQAIELKELEVESYDESIALVEKYNTEIEKLWSDQTTTYEETLNNQLVLQKQFLTDIKNLEKERTESATKELIAATEKYRLALIKVRNKEGDPNKDKDVIAAKTALDEAKTKQQTASDLFSTADELQLKEETAALNKILRENEEIREKSDIARAITLSNSQRATSKTIADNESILSSERSTLKERLTAIEVIAGAQIKAAKAQRDNILSSIGLTDDQAAEANNAYRTEFERIFRDASKFKIAEKEKETDRILDATQAQLEAEKSLTIKYNDQITEGILLNLDQRTRAAKDSFEASKLILDEKYKNELKKSGLDDAAIAKFIATGETEVAIRGKILDELLALRAEHETEVNSLVLDFSNKNVQIMIDELDRIRKFVDEGAQQIGVALSESLLQIDTAAEQSQKFIRDRYTAGKVSAKSYGEEIRRLNRQQNKDRLEETNKFLIQEIALFKGTKKALADAEQELAIVRERADRARGTQNEIVSQQQLKQAEADYQSALEYHNRYIELNNSLVENQKAIRENAENDRIEDLQIEAQMWEYRFDLLRTFEAFAQNIVENNFNRRMQMIDDEEKALQTKADKEKAIIEQAVLNEEEKAKRLAELELKTINQQEILDKKRRKLERDRAIAERQFQILRVVTDQAASIAKVSFQAAINPLQAPLLLAQIPFIIASGVAAIATILSAPLPKLAHGSKDFEGGMAIVGDAGKSELVVHPDGSSYLTGSTPEVRFIPKHSVVLPDANAVLRNSMMEAGNSVIGMSSAGGLESFGFGVLDNTMKSGFTILTKTIKNKPEVILRRGMNKDLLLRYGSDYWKYIN